MTRLAAVSRNQHGLALIAVLWISAALGLIAMGLSHSVKTDARVLSQNSQRIQVQMLADSAIRSVLLQLLAEKKTALQAIESRTVTLWDQAVTVDVMPLNGWIDLNSAPVELLQAALQFAAGLNEADARMRAQAIVDFRERKTPAGESARIHAIEDLLQIPLISYEEYSRVAPLMTADLSTGNGKVNPLAAPAAVLRVLAGGDDLLAQQVEQLRLNRAEMTDLTRLPAAFTQAEATRTFRIQARVMTSDNTQQWLHTWRVFMTDDKPYGLPWRVLGIDHPVILPVLGPQSAS